MSQKVHNEHEGELLFYVNQDLNCRVLSIYPMLEDFEILALELRPTSWLIIGSYKSPSLSDITFTSKTKNILTCYRSTYDNILLMGEFNMTLDNPNFNVFILGHELSALVSESVWFKSTNPTCIDNFRSLRCLSIFVSQDVLFLNQHLMKKHNAKYRLFFWGNFSGGEGLLRGIFLGNLSTKILNKLHVNKFIISRVHHELF